MLNGPILLVDDEPVVLRLNAATVEHFGFQSITAEDGDQAFDILQKTKVALVVSDVQMPGEGGFDLARRVTEAGLKTMPIMYLTGYNDIDIIRGGLKAGGDDFVIKGSAAELIRKRIAFWMTSGFEELPKDLRRRALKAANAVRGDEIGTVEPFLELDGRKLERIINQVFDEMAELPKGYGDRLIERVCVLARLSKMVIDECRTFGDFIRFTDYVSLVSRRMGKPWTSQFYVMLSHFDYWASDPRFGIAGTMSLREVDGYNFPENLKKLEDVTD